MVAFMRASPGAHAADYDGLDRRVPPGPPPQSGHDPERVFSCPMGIFRGTLVVE